MRNFFRRSKIKLPKVNCETARKIIETEDITDRDLMVASSRHMISCIKCAYWINKENRAIHLNNLRFKLEDDNQLHPEHKRNIFGQKGE